MFTRIFYVFFTRLVFTRHFLLAKHDFFHISLFTRQICFTRQNNFTRHCCYSSKNVLLVVIYVFTRQQLFNCQNNLNKSTRQKNT